MAKSGPPLRPGVSLTDAETEKKPMAVSYETIRSEVEGLQNYVAKDLECLIARETRGSTTLRPR